MLLQLKTVGTLWRLKRLSWNIMKFETIELSIDTLHNMNVMLLRLVLCILCTYEQIICITQSVRRSRSLIRMQKPNRRKPSWGSAKCVPWAWGEVVEKAVRNDIGFAITITLPAARQMSLHSLLSSLLLTSPFVYSWYLYPSPLPLHLVLVRSSRMSRLVRAFISSGQTYLAHLFNQGQKYWHNVVSRDYLTASTVAYKLFSWGNVKSIHYVFWSK